MEGFHLDDEGDWVAELECGHGQHVRHRPPFQMLPWVVDEEGRRGRMGAPLDCPLCDRAEMPDGLEPDRTGDVWDERSIPAGLRRDHRLGPRTWGRLHVLAGRLRFVPDGGSWATGPVDLDAGSVQAIPPLMAHHVETAGPVSLRIDFYKVAVPLGPGAGDDRGGDDGGDPACWAHMVCAACGALVDRPGAHRPGCPQADAERG